MNIGILGTGTVGQTIGSKLIQLGHEVRMGSRTTNNEKATQWVAANGPRASQGTFANAAAFGEILFNCTAGVASLQALEMANGSRAGLGCGWGCGGLWSLGVVRRFARNQLGTMDRRGRGRVIALQAI